MEGDVTSTSGQVAAIPDMADMSEFGIPEQVFPVSSWVLVTCGLVALAGLGPAAMAFYFLRHPFGTNPPPRELMMIGGSAFVLMSAVLGGLTLSVRNLTYMVFPEALVEMRGGRNRIFRWDEITEVFEDPRGTTRYRIVVRGRRKSIASIVQNHQALGETIATTVTRRLLPPALRTFETGGTVAFGRLSVSSDLLTFKHNQLAWSQIGTMAMKYNPQMKSTRLEVRVDGQFLPWCSVAVRNIPNLRVFVELARRSCPNCAIGSALAENVPDYTAISEVGPSRETELDLRDIRRHGRGRTQW